MTDEKIIAFGGALKATQIDDATGRIGGYLIYFTGPDERDLHGEYFTGKTDLCIPVENMNGLPFYYQHGLDETLGIKQISVLENVRLDDAGVWAEAQLDLHDEYERAIFKLAQKGALGFSSGAWPQSVKTADDGWIARWRVIEGSGTPTPAMPKRTVISAKAYGEMLKGDTGHEEHKPHEANADTQQHTKADSTPDSPKKEIRMDRLQELLAEIVALFQAESPMTPTESTAMTEGLRAEVAAMPDEEKKALDSDEESAKAAKSKALTKLFAKAAKVRQEHKTKLQTSLKGHFDELKNTADGESAVDKVGNPTKATQISVSEDLAYADLTGIDMALALKMRQATLRGIPYDPQHIFGKRTEVFMKTLAHKMEAYIHRDQSVKGRHQTTMKSFFPWKTNELNASNIVGQGLEWVGEVFDSDLWLKPRLERHLYDELVSAGMWVRTIPQGADSINIPTEGNDPRWYTAPQAASVDATGKPETTAKFTPIGTGTVPLSAPELVCATSVTYVLEEDSIVAIAPEVNRQINDSFLEMRDSLILNGDIVRTNAANINYIDGTPPGGLESPSYLAFDGLRKMALVTYTDQARFGGALEYADFLATIFLLPYRVRSRARNIVLVVTPNVEEWGLLLPENSTRDVRRDNDFTNATGRLPITYGQMPYTTDLLPLTGVAGKEYQITTANNIYGTILAAYAPWLAFGNKRQITIESARNMYSGTLDWVARVRMGMVTRGADGVGLTYGLSQTA